LSADDEIITIQPTTSGRTVCATAAGKMLAFPTEDIAELSGPGRGVILMRLDTDDRLIGATTIAPGAGVTVVNKNGKDRKIPRRDIPLGRRAGKGQRVVKRSVLAHMHSGVVEREV
jgi:DNA gyrase/topoisomerase IV subunit A